jgi:hypothetical protein
MSTQPDDWTLDTREEPAPDLLLDVILRTPIEGHRIVRGVARNDKWGMYYAVQVPGVYDHGVKLNRSYITAWRYVDECTYAFDFLPLTKPHL